MLVFVSKIRQDNDGFLALPIQGLHETPSKHLSVGDIKL